MRRQFDRRVAAGAFGLAAVAMLATVGFAGSSGPVADRADPAAAGELLALMRAGERGSWSVTYDFTRALAGGRTLRQSMQEARVPSLHVLRSGSVMTVEQGKLSFNCNLVERRPACTESAAGAALAPSEVLRVAVSVGAYAVAEDAGTTIAGERAHCYRVLATGHGRLADLGTEADLCLAASGVSLLQRIVRPSGDTDERRARVVVAPVTRAAVREVARGFDPSAAIGRG